MSANQMEWFSRNIVTPLDLSVPIGFLFLLGAGFLFVKVGLRVWKAVAIVGAGLAVAVAVYVWSPPFENLVGVLWTLFPAPSVVFAVTLLALVVAMLQDDRKSELREHMALALALSGALCVGLAIEGAFYGLPGLTRGFVQHAFSLWAGVLLCASALAILLSRKTLVSRRTIFLCCCWQIGCTLSFGVWIKAFQELEVLHVVGVYTILNFLLWPSAPTLVLLTLVLGAALMNSARKSRSLVWERVALAATPCLAMAVWLADYISGFLFGLTALLVSLPLGR